jgi:hypothetical protein
VETLSQCDKLLQFLADVLGMPVSPKLAPKAFSSAFAMNGYGATGRKRHTSRV